MNNDQTQRLTRLKRLAWLLDDSIRIPVLNRRIGLDSLIGLVPFAGDIVGGGISAYLLLSGYKMGASVPTLLRMAANVVLEMIVGAVPLLGDVFDMAFKANQRNVRLLQRHADDAPRVERRSRAMVFGALFAFGMLMLAATIATLYVTMLAVRWLIGLF